jgi:hypothetical protein
VRLALSSAAAPDLSPADLLQACRGRGLAGLELVLDERHGTAADAEEPAAEEITRAARDAGIAIVAVRTSRAGGPLDRALLLARSLDAPALLPAGTDLERTHGLQRHAEAGGRVLYLHGTDASALPRLRARIAAMPVGSAGLAWEIDPAGDDPAAVPGVLAAAGADLRYIRLRGGGPESAQQTGLGVGALMARLALARYAGPLVLTPSTPRYHHVWRTWLGRGGGWGCGSKQSDASLVVLSRAADG